jgi:signal transduction histidine kinase
MQPVPGLGMQRALLYVAFVGIVFGATLLAFRPTLRRLHRTTTAISEAARTQYASVAVDRSKDEIGTMGFVFNTAAAEIHRRGAENADRIEALRRHVEGTVAGVVGPLADLERDLGEGTDSGQALAQAHDAAARLENLVAAAQLRLDNKPLPGERGDLREAVKTVADRHAAWARAAGVTMDVLLPEAAVDASFHPLFERALANIIDNAVRYSASGSRVAVTLEPADDNGFVVRVTDTGQGVTDEHFKGLTANRRFRGDEAETRRPNMRGLGLAVAREIADRSGLELVLRKPPSGGFEAELRSKARSGNPR